MFPFSPLLCVVMILLLQCNVLISDDGQALLTDFGFSSLVLSSFTLPVGTHSMVSINWIAPESLEDFKPTVEGDIWAYGMTALV